MNEKKIQKLFEVASKESPPGPTAGFEADVMRAVRREPHTAQTEAASLFQALNALFPRAALASVLVIVACVATDYFASPRDSLSLNDEVAQASEQWLFIEGGF
jgi:hypothetical protein